MIPVFIDFSIVVIGGAFLLTQIILPLWRSKPLFPLLREVVGEEEGHK